MSNTFIGKELPFDFIKYRTQPLPEAIATGFIPYILSTGNLKATGHKTIGKYQLSIDISIMCGTDDLDQFTQDLLIYLLCQVRNIAEQERATPKRIPFYASEFMKYMNLHLKSEIIEKILTSLKALKDSDVELEVEIKSNDQSRSPICSGDVVIDSFIGTETQTDYFASIIFGGFIVEGFEQYASTRH